MSIKDSLLLLCIVCWLKNQSLDDQFMFPQYFGIIIDHRLNLSSGFGFNFKSMEQCINLISFMPQLSIFEDTCQQLESVLNFYL